MEETIKLEMTKSEAKQLQAMIADCLEKMRQSNERMDSEEEEIARLKAETRIMLNQIKVAMNVAVATTQIRPRSGRALRLSVASAVNDWSRGRRSFHGHRYRSR